MTYGSKNLQYVTIPAEGVQWTCLVCDGIEETAPGYEPPSPLLCPSCIRLAVVDELPLPVPRLRHPIGQPLRLPPLWYLGRTPTPALHRSRRALRARLPRLSPAHPFPVELTVISVLVYLLAFLAGGLFIELVRVGQERYRQWQVAHHTIRQGGSLEVVARGWAASPAELVQQAQLPALLGTAVGPMNPIHNSPNGATTVDDRPATGPRPLSEGERTLISVTAAAVGALGLIGFIISFATVMNAAKPTFGPLAFMLPLGVDLGIGVFSALDIVLARLDMRVRWLRFIPWTLTAATVYLNVAAYANAPNGPDWFAVVAHAILPGLWVVAVEIGTHAVRKRANLAGSSRRLDSIRVSRWLLSPLPTFALWRRMVLWEVRSYPDALNRERERILAKTDLQDRYGRLWQFKATRRERALYKLGELAPADAVTVRLTTPPQRPALTSAPVRKSSSRKRRTARQAIAPSDVDDLMPLGWQIAADHKARGVTLTRDRLRDAIRQTGQSVSTDRAGALLARLRSETSPTAETTGREAA